MLEEKEFLKLISQSIRKRRLDKKFSSERLAELTEIDYSSINQIENCKQNPRSYTLYKLLHALDIDVTAGLKAENEKSEDIKAKIAKKMEVMSPDQLESLLNLMDNFKIIKK